MNMRCGLYRIINKVNGKFYIGSSYTIENRWKYGHISKLKKNKHDNEHLQRAWNKYGQENFDFVFDRKCDAKLLLIEEQKELDIWVGKPECYNMRKSATCPIAPGSKRPDWVIKKCADAQRGKPRLYMIGNKWNVGRKHKPETIEKLKRRPSSFENIKKAYQANVGKIYSKNYCENISKGKKKTNKKFTDTEIEKIKLGVQKAVKEGRYHKNKVPLNEYENIKELYLSGKITQRNLALKYGINSGSMCKLLKRIGVK